MGHTGWEMLVKPLHLGKYDMHNVPARSLWTVCGLCSLVKMQHCAREEIFRCVRNFGGVEGAKDMRSAANLGEVLNRAVSWLKGKAALLALGKHMMSMIKHGHAEQGILVN